ncbi:hypothetical protein P0136_07680 [Lentisphaerota bacterium ZTH]|nr:hypothetical protein JYG24_01205 [Lentisphaerota bacterium]WET05250.1 hypothetical protein P0136_07680 [Lentisphaerota bacterium ZTH]
MPSLRERLEKDLKNWRKNLPKEWLPAFKEVELDFKALDYNVKLNNSENIWPRLHNPLPGTHIFKAFGDLPPDSVRVVIFGNDPYTKERQATGRSFEQGNLTDWQSDFRFRTRVSPSLQSLLAAAAATDPDNAGYSLVDQRMAYNDYEYEGLRQPIWFSHVELARGIADEAIKLPPPDKIFAHWASQGVLWLNRTLTYTKWDDSHRDSHRQLWQPFTECVLDILVSQAASKPVAFVMWGSSADDLEDEILRLQIKKSVPTDNLKLIKAGHPQWPANYFANGNPLQQINEYLLESGPAVNWT